MSLLSKLAAWLGFLLLATVMAGLMWGPIHEESATADEAWILGAGYTYCKGMGFRMHPDEPPLAKMWSALPLMFMPVTINTEAQSLFDGRTGYHLDRPWRGDFQEAVLLFPEGRDNWYYWPWFEGERFGQFFLYGGENDADRLLGSGRLMQVVLGLLTAVVIFLWASQLAGRLAGLLGCALWVFNPVALAHCHIVQTDGGGTLTLLVSLWSFTAFVQAPRLRNASLAGFAFGLALTTKLSALLLLPIFSIVTVLVWKKQPAEKRQLWSFVRLLPAFVAGTWLLILLVYAPHWKPAPPLKETQAAFINAPSWFEDLRPILIPRDFFKAVALLVGTAEPGHVGYLLGERSPDGWWYYYPVAFALKTPIPFLALMSAALVGLFRRLRSCPAEQLVPWASAGTFFVLAMLNQMNIGVRHLLPVYGILSVAIAVELGPRRGLARVMTIFFVGWLALVAVCAHPFYIEYFNEFAGGTRNGHKYLLDSNLDWGQDLKRLKKYMTERKIDHCYLTFFGVERAIAYYSINATIIEEPKARQLDKGILVISAMHLMHDDWQWLREKHKPIDRVGYSLFVYQIGG